MVSPWACWFTLLGDSSFRSKVGLTRHVARCLEVAGLTSAADGVSNVAKYEEKSAPQSRSKTLFWGVGPPAQTLSVVAGGRAVGWVCVIEAVVLHAAGGEWWEVPELALLVEVVAACMLWGVLCRSRVERGRKGILQTALLPEAPCGLV